MSKRIRRRKRNREWGTFERCRKVTREECEALCREMGITDPDDIEEVTIDMLSCETFKSDRYTVAVYPTREVPGWPCGIIHLSIKHNDRIPIDNWNHMQRIKNELVGPEFEAVQIYPAESRLVNLANQYHLWVLDDPEIRFPFGFAAGRAVSGDTGGSRAKQRLEETGVS